MVVQKNPVHCLLALILTLVAIGALFVALDAVTVGFLQIIVYVGAIMVLFLFVIWLLNLQAEPVPCRPSRIEILRDYRGRGDGGGTVRYSSRKRRITLGESQTSPPGYGSIDSLAQTLFGQYLMAFETTSILLLVAVIGAVAIARRALPDRARSAPTQGTPT